MEQHEDAEAGSFIPDAYNRAGFQAKAGAVLTRNRWRVPAVATSMAVVAALCLNTGSAAHATATPAKPAAVAAHAVVGTSGTSAKSSLTGHVEAVDDAASKGGVHGAFNLYDGVGGAVEFWFDPNTGQLTMAVGVGVGTGGGGVIGTYAPGSVPEPGVYVYGNTDLSAGTVATVNVAGSYSLTNGVFVGSINTTVEGRTLTIASDGGKSFDVSVIAEAGSPGFSGAVGVNYTFSFNITDVINYIWNAITNFFTGLYSLEDNDSSGDVTVAYEDDSSTTDDSDLTTDDSSSDASSDDAADDASDDAGDSGDGGDGGGGGCAVTMTRHADQAAAKGSISAASSITDLESDPDPIECE